MSIPNPIQRRIYTTISTTICAGVASLALCTPALAQDALGQGNALDANTGQRGRINAQRPSFANELSFRNAIATGNAPGGLSFRGDLGYRSAGEFSGELGSDSLFAFRRDSLYSGLAGMGIRGTDAIQYQFALTTGAMPPRNLTGNLSLARDRYYNPSGFNPGNSSARARPESSGLDTGIRFDQEADRRDLRGKQLTTQRPDPSTGHMPGGLGSGLVTGSMTGPTTGSVPDSMLGSLRSASTYATTSNLQPALLSIYTEGIDERPIGLIASPLLGITTTPMAQEERPANPLVARPSNANPTNPNAPGGIGPTRLTTSYDALVEQMRAHVQEMREQNQESGMSTIQPDESNDSWLVRQMQDLREKLYGVKPANENEPNTTDPNATDPNATDPADLNNASPDGTGQQSLTKPLDAIPTDPEGPLSQRIEDALRGISSDPTGVELYDPTVMAIDPETLEVLRGAAANEVEQLLDPGAGKRDLYAEHMLAGQRLIAQGRYFDAEERFTHALSIRPGDIPSQLGRLHAQIGAGMVLSAAVNLQSLFSMHPEVIASRYTGKLLPGPKRIESLMIRLKERSGIEGPVHSKRALESDQIRVSSALLLAYIGYQVDDQEALVSGLAMVNEIGTDLERRFASLLTQVWIIDHQPDPVASPRTSPETSGALDAD